MMDGLGLATDATTLGLLTWTIYKIGRLEGKVCMILRQLNGGRNGGLDSGGD
ncbi:hypothetical protein [Archaeoglobus veneficus]|uniref:Uncharacterized protein n=1 Tax=Archaeoglobus veneficus (strain DSM 11195 / SNP6) TaxID=693661 RepID=F2KSJ2_ARCVS|nr:hypothetical protein [Archaeoglobus veneficus]AEA48062.1 hypothetical protein Arcve_2072 [Archaeoglobus veneficus SNP6]